MSVELGDETSVLNNTTNTTIGICVAIIFHWNTKNWKNFENAWWTSAGNIL